MIEPLAPVVELHSRLGRVGSIQAWDPWKARESVEHAMWWVSKIASISYGNEAAKNPEALFKSIMERGHLSCLEFVPGAAMDYRHLPAVSMRHWPSGWDMPSAWGKRNAYEGSRMAPATAFLVECPLYTRSQWMRHRSFSYLEMSRRYTKGSKVEWSYYGKAPDFIADADADPTRIPMGFTHKGEMEETHFWDACEAEYQRRLDAGWPNEIARGCMPMEAMTRFWVAGFNRDWDAFIKLRDDPHAQPEIRVFAQWIRNHIHPEPVSLDAGNLGT